MLSQFVYNAIYPVLQLRSRRQLRLFQQMSQLKLDVTDSKTSTKFYLKTSKLYIQDDLFQQMESNDFIEIYDSLGVQIFRSFNLYLYSSFSEEELATQRMDQLYDRPEFFNKLLYKTAKDLFCKKKTIAYAFCPKHTVVEKKQNGLTVEINYKFMAPVFDHESHEIIAVLVCESIKPLFQNPESLNVTL